MRPQSSTTRGNAPPHLARGYLDVLRPEPGGTLLLSGWCLPFEPASVLALEASLDGEPQEILEARLGEPSPDVAAEYPGAAGAGHARWHARVRAPHAAGARDCLVRVTPILGGARRALSVCSVLAPTALRPTEAEVASIGGGYEEHALEFLAFFLDLCGLSREGRVLDVGCGIGRMALGLTAWLRGASTYLGFDVMPDAIAAARRTIGERFPRFRFEAVDVGNGMYRERGGGDAAQFRFPAEDSGTDLAILASVLTHLREPHARRYLDEVARVLAPDGKALVTAFVMDEEAGALVAAGRSSQPFAAWNGCFTVDAQVPEKSIAFAPAQLSSWIAESGLAVHALNPGVWCGRSAGLSYQDVLVLGKA